MITKRFQEYKTPITSWSLNEKNQGLLCAGRYRGFDGMEHVSTSGSAVTINLNHTVTGFFQHDDNNSVDWTPCGLVVTQAGTIIHIPGQDLHAVIDFNVGSVNHRLDVIALEYTYVKTQNGQEANLVVIKGANDGLVPGLANQNQVALCIIDSAPGANAFSALNFWKYPVPTLGNAVLDDQYDFANKYAQLHARNVFTKTQASYKPTTSPTPISGTEFRTGMDGNFTLFNPYEGGIFTSIRGDASTLHYPGTRLMIVVLGVLDGATFLHKNLVGLPTNYELKNGDLLDMVCTNNSPEQWFILSNTGRQTADITALKSADTAMDTRVDALEVAEEAWKIVGVGAAPAFGTGWSNTSPAYRSLRFKKEKAGYLVVEGMVQYVGGIDGVVVFTLPAGYVPSDMTQVTELPIHYDVSVGHIYIDHNTREVMFLQSGDAAVNQVYMYFRIKLD